MVYIFHCPKTDCFKGFNIYDDQNNKLFGVNENSVQFRKQFVCVKVVIEPNEKIIGFRNSWSNDPREITKFEIIVSQVDYVNKADISAMSDHL